MNTEQKESIFKNITSIVTGRSEIIFAYVHGSFISSDKPNDIDIAFYVDPSRWTRLKERTPDLEYIVPLEMEIEKQTVLVTRYE